MTRAAVAGPLVVGYGNPLRADDGLGWHAAGALLAEVGDGDPRDGDPAAGRVGGGLRVLQRHQLTPELAVDVAASSYVVFVDARPDDGGGVETRRLAAPDPGAGPGGAWTHHTTPEALLSLARDVGGEPPPPATLVTAPAACLDVSDQLSPHGREVLDEVVREVTDLVRRSQRAART